MNTYNFLNNPTSSKDVKSFIKKLEEVITISFERQLDFDIENENSAVIISKQVMEEELAS
ncbi:MAG: hypothetical protein NC340_01905 [Ruminococcus flavefaciens]|nr:hypothetical protein [Ruminococcus flavefaciens]MCM1228902.1 hypothetical protein [Ruminococcus flavefaciens]MCM1506444.1 hypothetical protein [Ruminococcus flavefaciens]